MLKRLLASLAIVSLLIAGALLVYWWRSSHGHVDSYTMGKGSPTQTVFTTGPGVVWVRVIDSQKASGPEGIVAEDMRPHRFREFLGYFLLIPGLWLAIQIRNLLPRPPGRELRVTPNPKPELRRKSR